MPYLAKMAEKMRMDDERIFGITKLELRAFSLAALEIILGATAYLIFVIFLHRQNFWRIKFTQKNANFCECFANFCQLTPKFAPKNTNFCQFAPIFCVKSVKIYTGQKKFTRVEVGWALWSV